jgi:anthranilate phosphoribosyltransferase
MRARLERLLGGSSLDEEAAYALFEDLADPRTPPVAVGAVLAALRAKGETGEEIRGLARAMRARARSCVLPFAERLVDVVGTGGDGTGSFNLSTGSALLAAACGVPVAKHGSGAVSGRCGSADVLRALGLPLPLPAEAVPDLLETTGFTFLHAPSYHPALATLAPLRRALGTRTVFNLLGPLAHPAAPPFAVIGAFSIEAARAMAEALTGLPLRRAFVVHGANGWDEPTPVGPFHLFDVRPGRIVPQIVDPAAVGLRRARAEDLRGGDAETNARALRRVFEGEASAHRDALVLGAALAQEVAGRCGSLGEGVARAGDALRSGGALRLLNRVAAFRPREARRAHA